MRKRIDRTGQVFGRLTVLQRDESARSKWICRCECGTIKSIYSGDFQKIKSCGCYIKEMMRGPSGESAFTHVWTNYTKQAKSRGLQFKLNKEFFRSMISKDCFYCGAKPSNLSKNQYGNGDLRYNGIDRMDSSVGYLPYNCVPCCAVCNRSKSDMTTSEYVAYLNDLVIHRLRLMGAKV